LLPEVHAEVMWDYSIWADPIYKKLVAKALTQSITENEISRLIEAIKYDPDLAIDYGITPANLPIIIQINPELAVNIFIYLNNNTKISE